MVFLANLDDGDYVFTIGLFGVQFETLSQEKQSLISTLDSLLKGSAGRVDLLHDHTFGLQRPGPQSTVFIAYWLDFGAYHHWKQAKEWTDFWHSLPDDAGVWREVMSVPKSRFTHACTQNIHSGLATLLNLKHSTDEGYWGVYRHRMSETPDRHTDPRDTFTSPYVTTAKANNNGHKTVFEIPRSFPAGIRKGRVRPTIPDNLLFFREAQRNPNCISKEEIDTYLEHLAPRAVSWINHLDVERNKCGVLSFSTHVGQEKISAAPSADDIVASSNPVAETNQIGYFLDLAHFELAGRSHKAHVQMRKNVLELYGSGGKFAGEKGKAILYVELCVLKQGDLEAEYIGCWEGTGLLYLDDLL